jgi:transcription initiation factor TFIIB
MTNTLSNLDCLFDALDDFNKTPEESDEEKNKSIYFCEACEEESIKNIKGELICTQCSRTFGIYIDSSPEWRYYGSEDTRSSDPNRCGYPTSSNSLLKDFYMGSIIASKYNESYEMKLIRRRNIWISSNYREKSLITVFETLNSRAKKHGISSRIIEEAKSIYKEVSELKISRGENREGIIASCLYLSCCSNGARRSTKEIAEIFMIPHTTITKGFKKYYDIILNQKPELVKNKDVNISNSLDFIKRYCSNLEKFDASHSDLCFYVCDKIEKHDLVSENTPSSRAAGCICLVSYLFGLNESKRNISEVCKTSEVTISKCFNKLIEYYTILLPRPQLRFLAFSFIDKFSKNLEKYYDTQVYQSFYQKCLQMLNVCIKKNILKEDYHITMLAAAIVYDQIKKFEFSNLDMEDVSNVFNVQPSNIQSYYEKLPEI